MDVSRTCEGLYGRRPNPALTVPMVITLVVLSAATGYHLLGAEYGREWSFFDCVYMAVHSLITVGYGEKLSGFAAVPHARAFNMVVLVVGYGAMVWAGSTVVALAVEGRLGERLLRRRMMASIDAMQGHYILCGLGETGATVLDELMRTGRDVVVIEDDEERLAQLCGGGQVPFVAGDAESDAVLRQAGIERAAGLFACLPADKDNLYLVLSARQLNPEARLVARVVQAESREKLLRAGADAVVSPTGIGGMRLASEMVRPTVTNFLDVMLRNQNQAIRIEEVTVPEGSAWAGRTLREADFHGKCGLLVIAIGEPDGDGYAYNPGPSQRLAVGQTLIVLGDVSQIEMLQAMVHGPGPGR